MIRHADSHLDHNLTDEQVAFLLEKFKDRTAFFIETAELPEHLGTVPCSLYGPLMGDEPVPEEATWAGKRGNRAYCSRLVNKPSRPTRLVTVIAGSHQGEPCVLYTAFGGPPAPREPGDPTLPDSDREKSLEFWGQHAIAAD